MTEKKTIGFEPHAVHILSVRPTRIKLRVRLTDATVNAETKEAMTPKGFRLGSGHGDIDDDGPSIQVFLRCEVIFGAEDAQGGEQPYELEAEVGGLATWDRSEIDDSTVLVWAEIGSPYALLPYLRALVSDLTARTGFPPVHLPLMVVRPIVQQSAQVVNAAEDE